MAVNDYLKSSITPYHLLGDALVLIKQLSIAFEREVEEKAIILLNAASLHPSMSAYQLSMAHKKLGDCYFENGFLGGALDQYKRGLSLNERLSVKQRIKKLQILTPEELHRSSSPDIIADIFQYPEYVEYEKAAKYENEAFREKIWADAPNRDLHEAVRFRMVEEARAKNRVYDPEHEAEISRRLDALGEPYKSEFYRVREISVKTRQENETISQQELDILTLEAMERSEAFRNK